MTRRNFRFLILAQWLLSISALVASIATEKLLSPELRAYIEGVRNGSPTTPDWMLFVVTMLFVLFCIVVSVGLFQFRKWAKKLLWPNLAVGIALYPFLGPNVQTEWTAMLSYISSLADGMILALVYYSPVGEMFEITHAVQPPAGSGGREA